MKSRFFVRPNLKEIVKEKGNFKRYNGIPGVWTQELDAGLWTLDVGS